MSRTITERLYRWMHDKRVVTEVAEVMNMSASTLSAELRPTQSNAKLGADELVPLFNAIRQVGYGKELNGILYRFLGELKGNDAESVADEDLVPHVLKLTATVGILSDCADRVPAMNDIAELKRIRAVIETEMLPIVLQMESMIASRIDTLQPRRVKLPTIAVAPFQSQPNT